jgi:hypothetical protein
VAKEGTEKELRNQKTPMLMLGNNRENGKEIY